MKPYFDDGKGIQVYHGDCMEILPALPKESFDLMLTDPPYGIGDRMQGGTWGAAKKYADFRSWDVAPETDTLKYLISLAAVSIIWGGNYFGLPASRCWLAWDKQNAVPTMADIELAWTNIDKPAKRFSAPVGVHRFGHPSEKPLSLIKWAIMQSPSRGRGGCWILTSDLVRLSLRRKK